MLEVGAKQPWPMLSNVMHGCRNASFCVSPGDGKMQHVLWLYVKRGHFRLVIPRQQIRVMHDAIAEGYMLVPHGEMALLSYDWLYVQCFAH